MDVLSRSRIKNYAFRFKNRNWLNYKKNRICLHRGLLSPCVFICRFFIVHRHSFEKHGILLKEVPANFGSNCCKHFSRCCLCCRSGSRCILRRRKPSAAAQQMADHRLPEFWQDSGQPHLGLSRAWISEKQRAGHNVHRRPDHSESQFVVRQKRRHPSLFFYVLLAGERVLIKLPLPRC